VSLRVEFRIESTQQWVDWADRDPNDEDAVRIYGFWKGIEYKEYLYEDIPGNSWNTNRLNKFRDQAQEEINTVISLSDPDWAGDELILTDPNRLDLYHDGGMLVAQPWTINIIDYTVGFPLFELIRTPKTQRT
jgi:hypothetical protein